MKHRNILNHAVISAMLSLGALLPMQFTATDASAYTDVWNGSLSRPMNGKGTQEEPFLITSADEFAYLVQNYDNNSGICLHKYYRLTCDIDMNWGLWRYGISTVDNRTFRAHFDGDGHKISHLTIAVHANHEEVHAGIFGQLGGDEDFESVIENLEVDGVQYLHIEPDNEPNPRYQYRMGGLVGQMYANSRIENCVVSNVVFRAPIYKMMLPKDASIWAAPLVGDVQQRFGERDTKNALASARIVNSYGELAFDNGNIQGEQHNFRIITHQGVERKGLSPVTVRVAAVNGSNQDFEAQLVGTVPAGATYRWTIDREPLTGINGTQCHLNFDGKSRSLSVDVIDANNNIIGSGGCTVQPAKARLQLQSVVSVGGGKSYNIKTLTSGEGKEDIADQLIYEWQDMTDASKVVGTSPTLIGAKPGHTYLLVARQHANKDFAASALCTLSKPLYVCQHGIQSPQQVARYSADGTTTYPQGSDANDGLTPQTPLRTLRRAYELLSQTDNVADNVIIIMGLYDEYVWNAYEDLDGKIASKTFFKKDKPAIITGSYGNIINADVVMAGESVLLDADTRFENINFSGHASIRMQNLSFAGSERQQTTSGSLSIYAQNHDLTMGYGITVSNYLSMDNARGLGEGVHAPQATIYGGFFNPDVPEYDFQPNTISIKSGYWGRVIAGSRFTRLNTTSGNVAGSPRYPIRTTIDLEVSNAYNPYMNPYDVALVVGGQADGTCFALSQIDIKGTTSVGRVIGGNIGFGRKGYQEVKGQQQQRPSDSFFGRTEINVLGGSVGEMYGTNLGRNGRLLHPDAENLLDSCTTYFYGQSVINIAGGVVRGTIYGAGASGVTGLAHNDREHTFDPLIPYQLSNGTLAYGTYEQAKGKLPRIIVERDSVIHLDKTSVTINISGKSHCYGSIYGGSHCYSNQMRTHFASCQAGDLFGDTHINVSGGIVEGYIFGGGKGTLSYYDNHDRTGYPTIDGKQVDATYFCALAQIYGNTHVNISGGKVMGMVFGAGEGSYFRQGHQTINNQTAFMAAVYGNTYVNISGDAELHDFVFGGGNYGDVLRHDESLSQDGNTYVNITGGKFYNSIFAGGHGHNDYIHPEHSVIADIHGNANITINGGEFVYNNTGSRYDARRFFGIYGSGRTSSVVHGDTHVNAYRSMFSQQFLDSMQYHQWNEGRPWDRCMALCGGGFGDNTDVRGNTYVNIDLSQMPAVFDSTIALLDDKARPLLHTVPFSTFADVFGGGLNGVVYGSTHVDIRGNVIVRNVYGGSLMGDCGLNDKALNGASNYEHSNEERAYTTGTHVTLHSGLIQRVYGGSLLGNICGETHLTLGQLGDSVQNRNLYVTRVVGGNDASGFIAGSNNPRYGTHVNLLGGTVMGEVYGAGDGYSYNYDRPNTSYNDARNACVGRSRPHVASVELNLQGTSAADRLVVKGSVFSGGNSTTVGLFERDTFDRAEWGMIRELLVPNTGAVKVNVGGHVNLHNLYMGCNGLSLLRNIPYYTLDGETWMRGFQNSEEFSHFCRNVDMSLVPQLTFNADGQFHNNHPIDDRMGDILYFETPGEMDARDVTIDSFYGGGYRGSMTSDSCYIYTLPTGVTINKQVVGGVQNAYYVFYQHDGVNKDSVYRVVGGIAPYVHDYIRTDRVQLNLFNKFRTISYYPDHKGHPAHDGAKVFTGCLDRGMIMGYASLNFHGDLIGDYQLRPGETWRSIASEWNTEAGYIYGAGKGKNTEIIGNTYINIRGGVFNGEKCIPNALNVFGGGLEGLVVGRSNVSVDLQCAGATAEDANSHAIWGRVYGGGRMGDVCNQSRLIPTFQAPRGAASHVRVWSGLVGDVFGGARMANIEGRTSVEIEDRSHGHFHAVVDRVFGGNDLSGTIGTGLVNPEGKDSTIVTNTYVHITEFPHEDGTYSGFPLVGQVYGGGNGAYGQSVKGGRYTEGALISRNGDTLQLAGMNRPDVDITYLDISGGTIWKAFAGSNQGNVRQKSFINVNYKEPDVRARFDRTISESCYRRGQNVIALNEIRDVFTDDGTSLTCPFNIHQLYGGNNETDMIVQPEWNLVRGNVGSLYGGCNQGDVRYYDEEGDQNVHPGRGGNPGLELKLDSPDFYAANVFGGSRMGHVIASRIDTDAEGETIYSPVTFADNQYGTTIRISDGRYGNVFGGNDITGDAANGTHIIHEGGIVDEIYGAGNGNYLYKASSDVNKMTEFWQPKEQRYIYLVPTPKDDLDDPFKVDDNINNWRPNCAKSFVEVGGKSLDHMAYVSGAIYCGGKSSTITGPNGTPGYIRLDLGDYCVLNNVYMGSNGQYHTQRSYIDELCVINGFPAKNLVDDKGRSLIDHHMDAVAMHGLPSDFHFRRQYEKCYIGSFFMGGLYGSLLAHDGLDVTFPRTLTIFNKIVGGADRAELEIVGEHGESQHYVGGILWDGISQKPTINLDVQCNFINAHMDMNPKYADQHYLVRDSEAEGYAETGSPVYGGCFQSGRIEGTVNVTVEGQEDEEILF